MDPVSEFLSLSILLFCFQIFLPSWVLHWLAWPLMFLLQTVSGLRSTLDAEKEIFIKHLTDFPLNFSNSIIIHEENTSVKEVWKSDLKYHKIW